jgi:rsbT antagonist protein RsbS
MESEAPSRIVLNRMGGVLVATIQVDITSTQLARFREDLLNRLALERSPSLVLDLSGVSLMDVEEFEGLRKLSRSVAMMGAETWFVGLQPEVVATLVTLGARTSGLRTALDLDGALTLIRQEREEANNE